MVTADFKKDWMEFVQGDMRAYGLFYDPLRSAEDNTLRYLNVRRRTPRSSARQAHESKELCIPNQYLADYSALKKLLSDGGDLTQYLSRDLTNKRGDANDKLLNAWGIQHLHFRPSGTEHVLFVKMTDTDVFIIQALPHGPKTWVNTSLLKIIHDNWPDIAGSKSSGICGESLTANQRINLRKNNVNFATAMPDGTIYFSPGGGLTGAGNCLLDVVDCDKIFALLAYWQKMVEENEANFRSALKMSPSEELSVKVVFQKNSCYLYESTRRARLLLTVLG